MNIGKEKIMKKETSNTILLALLACSCYGIGVLTGFVGATVNNPDPTPPFEMKRDYVTFEVKFATIIVDDKGKYIMKAEEVDEKEIK